MMLSEEWGAWNYAGEPPHVDISSLHDLLILPQPQISSRHTGLAAMMVGSFFVANCIAWFLESGRRVRIADKTKLLSKSSKLRCFATSNRAACRPASCSTHNNQKHFGEMGPV